MPTSAANPTAAAEVKLLPRILIVDHFDSYTLNILSLLSTIAGGSDDELSRKVIVLPHTHRLLSCQQTFQEHILPHFDAVILSPGPGSPDRRADFGFGIDFLRNSKLYRIPTLGVCLGHQGIAVAFGGQVKRARSIQHGTLSQLRFPKHDKTEGAGLFDGIATGTRVTRYNSLTIEPEGMPDCLEVTAYADDLSNPVASPCPSSDLMRSRATSPHLATSERAIMGISHKTLPLWGVQFHPESIESQGGVRILQNFLGLAEWWALSASASRPTAKVASPSTFAIPLAIVGEGQRYVAVAGGSQTDGCRSPQLTSLRVVEHRFERDERAGEFSPADEDALFDNLYRKGVAGSIWLDSARKGDPQSKFSYMANPSFTLAYHRNPSTVALFEGDEGSPPARLDLKGHQTSWAFMDALQKEIQATTLPIADTSDPALNKFKTGFVGSWSFEMKDEALGLDDNETISAEHVPVEGADAASVFGFCEAVLQYDHARCQWSASILLRDPGRTEVASLQTPLLQQLCKVRGKDLGLTSEEAQTWIDRVGKIFASLETGLLSDPSGGTLASALPQMRSLDSPIDYKAKVEAARALIAQGESYELCVTTQFVGQLPQGKESDPFVIYRGLRARNPSPYSGYVDLPSGTASDKVILSTSPERFLSMTAAGKVEMKPIKGTLPRAGYGRGEGSLLSRGRSSWVEQEDALRRAKLEADPKERAENLMIVDLIRADLMSFCLPSSIKVPMLMQVESYESVHQLVTTVQGVAKKDIGPVEAVRRCFPPGSMTGAPKRRSVTLLERLEGKSRASSGQEWKLRHRPRGIYSGVLGWIGVDGAADFCVVIRTAIVDKEGRISIGAGGAITYLSDADREWEEVLHKVSALAEVDMTTH